MSREPRRGYAGEHQTRQDRDGQNVLLDLLALLRLGGAKDDALHLVVYATALFEFIRVRVARQVVQVRLEEPEGLGGGLAGAWAMGYVSCPPEARH
jgi:hypothetical protein